MFRILALLLAVAFGCVGVFAAEACHASKGTPITLFGGVDDPDVLVWDSRDRLIAYSVGSADARQFLLPHAMLNRPGTRARVVSCYVNVVHPKFTTDAADAIGVIIMSGRYKGRYGWVSSADIHGTGVREALTSW
jgi:hypothetical protein